MQRIKRTINPLECKICKYIDCRYKDGYERLYNVGYKIPISDCRLLQELRDRKRGVWNENA